VKRTYISEAGKTDLSRDLTIPKIFIEQARRYGPTRVALREKECGIWRPITWEEYYLQVKHISLGLVELGLKKDDKVAMIGDNRPEGLWAELGTLCAGGVAVWLFQDCLMDEVQYIVDHCDARFLVCEGQEEVDKGLAIRDQCPKLERIIWDDPKGMRHYQDPILLSLQEVRRLGEEADRRSPELFEQQALTGHGDEVALLFYTSGTTSEPKGVLLSHYNMLTMGQHLMEVDPCQETDDFVSFLPFAWIGEQMMSISSGLQLGYTINFPEEPETSMDDLREVGPHVMFAPPRLYEQMTRNVQVKYLDAGFVKRHAFELAMKIGYRVADMKFRKERIPWHWRMLRWLAYQTVQRKLRDHLG
jgi:long-chain acyl-CoA synthetase